MGIIGKNDRPHGNDLIFEIQEAIKAHQMKGNEYKKQGLDRHAALQAGKVEGLQQAIRIINKYDYQRRSQR